MFSFAHLGYVVLTPAKLSILRAARLRRQTLTGETQAIRVAFRKSAVISVQYHKRQNQHNVLSHIRVVINVGCRIGLEPVTS